MTTPLRIATRQSPLALWQAEHVRARLLALGAERPVELVPMTTAGDRWLETPLSKIGGKNLFVKELEGALLDGSADLAVHSMKDVAAELPDGLGIRTVLEREDPHDALVGCSGLDALVPGARIGTSSLRRRSQLLARRPDLVVGMLRGNVNSRLAKLDAGEHDAIVLAAAGLMRLGFDERIGGRLPFEHCLPAIGQGIIGIETRSGDTETHALIDRLHDPVSAVRLAAERRLTQRLEGGCSAPLAGHATLSDGRLVLTGRVASLDGRTVLHASDDCALHLAAAPAPLDATAQDDALAAARALGDAVAERLLADGARAVLEQAARDTAAE